MTQVREVVCRGLMHVRCAGSPREHTAYRTRGNVSGVTPNPSPVGVRMVNVGAVPMDVGGGVGRSPEAATAARAAAVAAAATVAAVALRQAVAGAHASAMVEVNAELKT